MRLLSTAPPGARLTLVLCFIVALLEGMDLQAMGIAAPAMAKAFGFQPGQMGLVFSASILGLLPGAFIGGWCADRIGRKKVLIACVLIFGVFSVATAHVWSLESLLLARLLTGIGLGGALPNLIALSAESVDERARATAVSLMYCGVPLGGALAAVVGLLDVGRWQTVFYVGGLAPLLVAPLLGRYLAETAGFLRKRGGPQAGDPRGAWLGAIPLSTTLLLWLGYFFTLTVMYMLLNWLPSLLVGQGFSRGQAVGVQILFNLGGGIGSVLFGLLMDRWRPRLTVLAIYLGILLGLAGLGLAKAYPLVALAGFAAGLFVVGGQLVLYALAPQLYPAAVRATGTGAAVAVGRLGAMAGPLLAGQVLALGGGAATLVVATTPAVLVAAGAVLALLQRRAPAPRLQPARRRRGMRNGMSALYDDVLLLDGVRTPWTDLNGALGQVSPTDLGIAVARALLARGHEAGAVDSVLAGSVAQASFDAYLLPRHIGLYAGVPEAVPALQVQRVCGTGLELLRQAGDQLQSGQASRVLCVAAESMTRNPIAAYTHRSGFRLGAPVEFHDFLWEALKDPAAGLDMIATAERLAQRHGIAREAVDAWALRSFERALAAQRQGWFREEVVPVTAARFEAEGLAPRELRLPRGCAGVEHDSHPRDTSREALARLTPVHPGGVQTAGNSCAVADGAAAVLLARGADAAPELALAWMRGSCVVGVSPDVMGSGPVPAIQGLLDRAGLRLEAIDRLEINEAQGAQLLAVQQALELDPARLNVHGGAIALGHPLAATGLRLAVTLARQLRAEGLRYGVAAVCIGGGQGMAVLLENPGWRGR